MPKQIIVRLRTGSTSGPIVANSQIITIDGLGNSPIRPQDFEDGVLQGSVSTASQQGVFYKRIVLPQWTITPSSSTVAATNSLVFTWTTTVTNTVSSLQWMIVTPGTSVEYTGEGIITKRGSIVYSPGVNSGSLSILTGTVTADTQFQVTLWAGQPGVGKLLARSITVKISGIALSVSGPSSVVFNQPITITVRGYPNELVSYTGATTGSFLLNSTGFFSNNVNAVDTVTGLPASQPGNYTWTFDGDKTINNPSYSVTVTAKHVLTMATPNPASFSLGDAIQIGIIGAPNEVVTVSSQIDPSNVTTVTLNSSGTATYSIPGVYPLGNYIFKLKGTLTPNEIIYNFTVISGYNLSVTGPTNISGGEDLNIVVTGAPNEQVLYKYVAPIIPSLYFDYYPDVAGAYAMDTLGLSAAQYAETHFNQFGPSEGKLSSAQLETLTYSQGSVVLDSSGRASVNLGDYLGRSTPYTWTFDGNKTVNIERYSLAITNVYELKVIAPTSATSAEKIEIRISGAPGEVITYTGSDTAIGLDGSLTLNAAGKFNTDFSIKDITNAINTPSGIYTWTFKGNKSTTEKIISVTVGSAVALTVQGPASVKQGDVINITLFGKPGEVVTFRYTRPTLTTNAYFDYYPDVEADFLRDNQGLTADQFAQAHYSTTGRQQQRLTPEQVNTKFENEPSSTPGNFSPLSSGGTLLVDLTQGGANTLAARKTPYTYELKGNQTPNFVTYSVTVAGISSLFISGPSNVRYGESITINITGAPNEVVTWNGVSSGSAALNSAGSLTIDINPNKDIRGGVYNWIFTGNKSNNSATFSLAIISSELQVNGPPVMTYGSAINITVNGIPNETVTFSGSSTGSYTLSSNGQVTFDLNPDRNIPVGFARWIFDGNQTTNSVVYVVELVADYSITVFGPSSVTQGQRIPVTVIGSPNETVYVTLTQSYYVSSGSQIPVSVSDNTSTTFTLALGQTGVLTQDFTNGLGLIGGTSLNPVRQYSIDFNGDKTPNIFTYKLNVNLGYTLNVFGTQTVTTSEVILVNVVGAPNELVSYTGPTSGTVLLDATGQGTKDITSRDGSNNVNSTVGLFTWSFSGSSSLNIATFTITITPSYTLTLTAPASINRGQSLPAVLVGAPNEIVIIKTDPATAYFTSYPDVAELYRQNSFGLSMLDYANNHYVNFGSKPLQNKLSPSVLANSGVPVTLSNKGRLSFDLLNGSWLPPGSYTFNMDGNRTSNVINYVVNLTSGYSLSVTGPSLLASGQSIFVRIKGAPNEIVNVIGSGLAAGININLPLNEDGESTSDATGGLTLAPGTYSYAFKGDKTPNLVSYSVIVTGASPLISFGSLTVASNPHYGFEVGPGALRVRVEIKTGTTFTATDPGSEFNIYDDLPTFDEFFADPTKRRGKLTISVGNFTNPYLIGTDFTMKIWVNTAASTLTTQTFSFTAGGQ